MPVQRNQTQRELRWGSSCCFSPASGQANPLLHCFNGLNAEPSPLWPVVRSPARLSFAHQRALEPCANGPGDILHQDGTHQQPKAQPLHRRTRRSREVFVELRSGSAHTCPAGGEVQEGPEEGRRHSAGAAPSEDLRRGGKGLTSQEQPV